MSLRTPESESDDAAPKRMRLGTKSCAECRRRKVRCIVPPDAQVCEGCVLHGVPCKPQQPRRRTKKQDEATEDAETAAMKRRLEDLEGMVRRLCGALETGRSADSVDVRTRSAEILKSIETPSTTGSSWGMISSASHADVLPEEVDDSSNESDRPNMFQEAPLIHLFEDSMLIQKDDARTYPKSVFPGAWTDPRTRDTLQQLAPLVPDSTALDLIFRATEKYWLLWPSCHHGPSMSDVLAPGNLELAKKFVSASLSSGKPSVAAKAVLWLALCVQQLLKALLRENIKLPTSQQALVDLYLRHARTLLLIDDDAGGSMDGVECMVMKYKLYINMGKPRMAWLWTRQAVTASITLGYHRLRENSDPQPRALWWTAWVLERKMALFLGLPSSVSDTHPGTSDDLGGPSVFQKSFQSLGKLAGRIVDRDQNYRTSSYAVTVQLNQDAEDLKPTFPEDWWQPIPAGLSLTELWHRQSPKFIYFIFIKLIHQPYMLRSITEKKYLHSWELAMEASRNAMEAYQDFRTAPSADANLCQLMDFQAFSAAMTTVVGHLTTPSRADSATREADWALIADVGLSLRRTAAVLDCQVAEQSARVLELLDAARRGAYVGPDDFAVTIPYFGRVRINRDVAAAAAAAAASSLSSSSGAAGQVQGPMAVNTATIGDDTEQKHDWAMVSAVTDASPFSNSVEFSTSEFQTDFPVLPAFDVDELCADWASPSTGFDVEYDWTQTFTHDPFY